MLSPRLNKYLKENASTILIGMVFVILSNLSKAFTPRLVQRLIDGILKQLKVDSDISMVKPLIVTFVLWYFSLTILSAVFTFFMRQTIVVTSHKIAFKLRSDFYQHIQKLKINAYHQYKIGDYMSRMAEDIGKIRELCGPALMYSINLLTSISITLYFMLSVNKTLTFYAMLPLPLLSISIFFINTYSYKFNKRRQELLSSLTSQAQESYNGIRIIKSFTLENKMAKKFAQISHEYKNQNLSIVKLESFFLPISTFLMSLSIITTIYVGGNMYLDGMISIGNLTEFIMYVQFMTWPVMSVGWVASLYMRGKASMDRYEEVMSQPEENYSIPRESLPSLDITFENVHYQYQNTGIVAVKNISFHIPHGEKWQIVGKTGSGKTTLAELLMKLYDDYEGNIKIGNKELRDIHLHELRENISYIPQDVFLFSDTVERNIAFADLRFSHDQVIQAAQDAQIYDEILGFSDQFDTLVGERGVTLSGGQKQRISIARALIKPSPIFLFDDCLSAVDVETEKNLIESIEHHHRRNTLIMISHRIYNQLKFDKIMVLDEGKIAELGNKEQLLANKGIYYEMYKKQELKGNSNS